jgi:hypothetical protein
MSINLNNTYVNVDTLINEFYGMSGIVTDKALTILDNDQSVQKKKIELKALFDSAFGSRFGTNGLIRKLIKAL